MTAQHHDVQHETPANEQHTTPDHTDPLPTLRKVGSWAMALAGVVGISSMAVAVMTPSCLPWVCGG
ncbi:hypothetical protein [Kribbella sp.]|uniref:hypothetical protein n=1 Tax=Kribbella sp. TaxID=1871183 RepID=UPI002D497AE4|nr:hypothetical protein [Kribbella sp.]HZX02071.1 hypothetical protein [Kribbella sp.]